MNKMIIASLVVLTSACSSTQTVNEPMRVPTNQSTQEVANRFTATCAGFAKAGAEKGYASELTIFSDCMDQVILKLETDPDNISGIDWSSLNDTRVDADIPAKPTETMNVISETYTCADNAHWSGWHKSDRLNVKECICDAGYAADTSGETLTCGEIAQSKT